MQEKSAMWATPNPSLVIGLQWFFHFFYIFTEWFHFQKSRSSYSGGWNRRPRGRSAATWPWARRSASPWARRRSASPSVTRSPTSTAAPSLARSPGTSPVGAPSSPVSQQVPKQVSLNRFPYAHSYVECWMKSSVWHTFHDIKSEFGDNCLN